MSVGMPCRQDTGLASRSTVCLEDGSLWTGIKWAPLESHSAMLRMAVDGGRPVTKSKAMCDQGWWGIWRGQSRLEEGLVRVLFGHRPSTPRQTPAHPPPLRATKSANQGDKTLVHIRVTGQVGGVSQLENIRQSQAQTTCLRDHYLGRAGLAEFGGHGTQSPRRGEATIQRKGRMGSGSWLELTAVNWRAKALGLMFLEPGR